MLSAWLAIAIGCLAVCCALNPRIVGSQHTARHHWVTRELVSTAIARRTTRQVDRALSGGQFEEQTIAPIIRQILFMPPVCIVCIAWFAYRAAITGQPPEVQEDPAFWPANLTYFQARW